MTSHSKSTVLLACLATFTAAHAQTPTTPQPDRPQQSTASANDSNRILASWIMLANNQEIELAQLATSRAQNPQVKQFAQMMIKDHEEMGRKLAPFSAIPLQEANAGDRTAGGGIDQPGRRTGQDTATGRDTGTGRDTDTGDRTGGRRDTGVAEASAPRVTGQSLDHIALLRDLGRKHLETAKQELQQKQGEEFDKCYMGMQVAGHAMVLDKLQVFPDYASGELRNTFQQAQSSVRQHLEKAKSIAKELMEKGKSGDGDRK